MHKFVSIFVYLLQKKMSFQSRTKLSRLWSVPLLIVCFSTEFYLKNSPAISGHVYEECSYYEGIISYFGCLGHDAI